MRAPTRPADSACRSATPLWPKVPDWPPPLALTVLYPSVAEPRLAAPSAPAANRRSTTRPIAAVPPGKLNPECFASTHAIAIKPDPTHAKCIS